VAWTSSFPFPTSSPFASSPTRGFRTPRTRSMKIAPIWPNWRSCDGLGSVLAPASISRTWPVVVGISAPIAGRSIPGMRPSVKRAAAITAPLFPAEIIPAACPSLTWRRATLIEALGLRRAAFAACSSIAITSAASTIGRVSPATSCLRNSASIAAPCPTSATSMP